jgi:hypothetical protein
LQIRPQASGHEIIVRPYPKKAFRSNIKFSLYRVRATIRRRTRACESAAQKRTARENNFHALQL